MLHAHVTSLSWIDQCLVMSNVQDAPSLLRGLHVSTYGHEITLKTVRKGCFSCTTPGNAAGAVDAALFGITSCLQQQTGLLESLNTALTVSEQPSKSGDARGARSPPKPTRGLAAASRQGCSGLGGALWSTTTSWMSRVPHQRQYEFMELTSHQLHTLLVAYGQADLIERPRCAAGGIGRFIGLHRYCKTAAPP